MRGILTITYLPVSQFAPNQFAQNNITNDETARLTLIGILSPELLFQFAGEQTIDAVGRIGPVQPDARYRALSFKQDMFELDVFELAHVNFIPMHLVGHCLVHNTQPFMAVTGAIHGCISRSRYGDRKHRRI